jgi:hypothetical protein
VDNISPSGKNALKTKSVIQMSAMPYVLVSAPMTLVEQTSSTTSERQDMWMVD